MVNALAIPLPTSARHVRNTKKKLSVGPTSHARIVANGRAVHHQPTATTTKMPKRGWRIWFLSVETGGWNSPGGTPSCIIKYVPIFINIGKILVMSNSDGNGNRNMEIRKSPLFDSTRVGSAYSPALAITIHHFIKGQIHGLISLKYRTIPRSLLCRTFLSAVCDAGSSQPDRKKNYQ